MFRIFRMFRMFSMSNSRSSEAQKLKINQIDHRILVGFTERIKLCNTPTSNSFDIYENISRKRFDSLKEIFEASGIYVTITDVTSECNKDKIAHFYCRLTNQQATDIIDFIKRCDFEIIEISELSENEAITLANIMAQEMLQHLMKMQMIYKK